MAADALTSVLAIAALVAGLALGWVWLDSAVGILGAAVIGWWAWGMLGDCGRMLLDYGAHDGIAERILARIEAESDNRVADLHVWQVGPRHLGVIISVVTHAPQPPEHYKALLDGPAAARPCHGRGASLRRRGLRVSGTSWPPDRRGRISKPTKGRSSFVLDNLHTLFDR